MSVFVNKFGDAAKVFDVTIREDRFFVSEMLALDSFLERLDDIILDSNQLIMVNLATLEVYFLLFDLTLRGFITNTVPDQVNTTMLSNY
jgi:hypothetical protein